MSKKSASKLRYNTHQEGYNNDTDEVTSGFGTFLSENYTLDLES